MLLTRSLQYSNQEHLICSIERDILLYVEESYYAVFNDILEETEISVDD